MILRLAKVIAKSSIMVITVVGVVSMGQRNVMDQKKEQEKIEWVWPSTQKAEPLLGRDGPFGETPNSSAQKGGTPDQAGVTPIVINETVGRLYIFAMRAPNPKTFDEGLSDGDRDLNVTLTGNEWAALFYDTLGCPGADDVPRLPGEDTTAWQVRYSLKFQQAIPDYPMLGRIWDIYIYASHKPEDIERLRAECLKVQASTSNEKTLAGLAKLLSACDEASKLGSGLLFAPD